jgi:hypothetical protein
MTTDKHANLDAALVAFQREMPTVAKSKRANVGQYAYTYADLADVIGAAVPVLTKHGLAFAGSSRHVEGGRYEVVGILSHESGEHREGALPISGNTAQQLGSAITYMRRYLFGVMTGVVTDNDDDGSLASAQKQRRSSTQPPPDVHPPPEESGVLLNTSSQLAKAMYAGINQAGVAEDERLPFISNVIGRDITSTKEMLESEARAVLRVLDQRKEAS